ncbi:MAG: peptidase S9 [Bacteroidetes bacterium CG23_combo_of_CG06-09_8_20_14_all_32_9]|nr:MAG: peptidase S9 [Bacteroidetes bacterium CG23_combo_of_CG06-09_8_20_14_all_32_9]
MKKITFVSLSIVSLIGLYSCCGNKEGKTSDLQTFVSKMDSLANQPITETKVNAELLWKFGRIGGFCLSPDQKSIVYTVTRYSISENKGYTDIFSVPVAGGTPKQLTTFAGPESNPRWRSDGKKIGFIAIESESAQIWEMNPDGNNQEKISDIEGGINSFEYSPDGTKVLYCKDVKINKTPHEIYPDLPKSDVIIAENLMYRHWNTWDDGCYSHIFYSEIKNGKISNGKDIMENEPYDSPLSPYFDAKEIRWSTNGKTIAYTCKKMTPNEYSISTNSDIYLYNVKTEKTENLTKGMPGYDKYPVFSPDGKYIAWQSMATPGYESDKQRLFVMDLSTKQKIDLTEKFDQNASNFQWTADNKKIYFISGIRATEQIYSIDVESQFIAQLKNGKRDYSSTSLMVKQITYGKHDYTDINLINNTLIGSKMSMSMATELFAVNIADGKETQITFTNKNIYDKVQMAESKARWIKTTDNKQMLVWIIYPPQFDSTKKYPAILYCQGGPQSAVSQFFSYRWNFQIMAANDYIIVAPNRRGLPSFGQEWNDQIAGDYAGQNMKDYLSAIDEVKKESYIDAEHIGCIGASYGAYSVYWLAGHHEKRFKAFIAHCGMFNLESQYAETEEEFFTNHDLGGPFWAQNNKVAQNTYANSPHKFVHNWDTPILIISGEFDFRIPYTESMQAFNSAQLLGIPSKLLFFPNESHFVLKPQNSILWQREFFGWLDKWLKPSIIL